MKKESLRIAPKGKGKHWIVDDYQALDFSEENDWQTAITIFEDRINGRFIEVINRIQKSDYSGFAVMALNCLLIETLQQFYRGKQQTPPRKVGKYFFEFLTSTSFGTYFDEQKANRFYDDVRNGILHQAETKGSTKIWIRQGSPIVDWTDDRKGLVINREKFSAQLVHEFESYVQKLRKNSLESSELRNKFKTKMDYICKVTA